MYELAEAVKIYGVKLLNLNNARDVEMEMLAAYIKNPSHVNAANLRDAWHYVALSEGEFMTARAKMMVHVAFVPGIG